MSEQLGFQRRLHRHRRCQRQQIFLTQRNPTVGAAEGCDLLILMLRTTSKDRSLRQLVQEMGVELVTGCLQIFY
ncbi:hypothetical protein D3C81_1383080 [compost metagenome]